jgi:hypothetical protein
MKKGILFLFVIGLSMMLLSCSKASQYDFSYTLNKYNYKSLMKITFHWNLGRGYVKYELDEEGYIENLILTFEVKKGFFDPSTVDKNVTLEKENEFVEFELNEYEILGTDPEIVRCAGTLYTNQFEYVYGLKMNKAKSDIKDLNEALEIYDQFNFYTVEYSLDVLDVKISSQMGFRTDPFYYYNWTPFDKTVYAYEEENDRYVKKYMDDSHMSIEPITESEMIDELGLSESTGFSFPSELGVYYEDEHYYIFGRIEDLTSGIFPEDTFEDISQSAQFKMSIKVVDEDMLILNFHVLNDDIDYDFQFVYDFSKFGAIDHFFELEN